MKTIEVIVATDGKVTVQTKGFTGSACKTASEFIEQVVALGLTIAEAPVVIHYSEYSLRKGQRLSNAVNILWETLLARLHK